MKATLSSYSKTYIKKNGEKRIYTYYTKYFCNGKKIGRPKIIINKKKRDKIIKFRKRGHSINNICVNFNLSRYMVYKIINEYKYLISR